MLFNVTTGQLKLCCAVEGMRCDCVSFICVVSDSFVCFDLRVCTDGVIQPVLMRRLVLVHAGVGLQLASRFVGSAITTAAVLGKEPLQALAPRKKQDVAPHKKTWRHSTAVDTYLKIAITLAPGATATLSDGTELSRLECIAKAIQMDPSRYTTLLQATRLLDKDDVVTVYGTPMTRVELIVMAIGKYPTIYSLYERLAEMLSDNETAKLPDGRIVNGKDCLGKASELR